MIRVALALMLGAALGAPQDAGTRTGDGWKDLFDGRTTNGWRGFRQQTMPDGWS